MRSLRSTEVSLEVRPGRVLGFLGPNGAGKTTAMRAVFGLVGLDAGGVLWDGPAGRAGRAAAVRLHAGGARPLPADAGRRAARLFRPPARYGASARHVRRRRNGWSGWVLPTAPTRRSRSSRTETSSVRSSRRRCCTSRSCSCSTSPSRGSIRSRCGRSPRCFAARRRAAPRFCSRAISSSWSRTSARRSRSSTMAGSS